VVVLVYRHRLVDPQAPENEAELIVAKNRNGAAPVTAYVDWDGPLTRFTDSNRTVGTGGVASDQGQHHTAAKAYSGPSTFGF
jgi:hypothetical protein